MDLVRELLDNQVVDGRGTRMGKVDGIVLELREDGPPRVAFLEIGASALAHRFSPLLGRWMEALAQHLGVSDGQPLRVPPSRLTEAGVDLRLDLDCRETSAMAWEGWVSRKIVRRIPGSGW